ncbi:Thyroid receptor-interacting protein 11 [Toxocara canis]|uniref:Thyroid receptor-interacting protein 11 n=1 Tax=Toxocara canis TaxID=6265 RepID=A0A0B2VJK2_TOXCA|nr:Thyroid receptor-interacting protein 11 [Toxocara canis]
MSAWLRNLQGQLTELASEVLTEATEEVDGTESELQVIKKKYADAERQLTNERANSEALLKKVADLEEQLYAKNVEIDSLNSKYSLIIECRDSQIRSLQVELERARHANDLVGTFADDKDNELMCDEDTMSMRRKDEIEQLRKEVAHWKRIVNESPAGDHSKRISELERKLGDQRCKSEAEMAALVLAHSENITHLREEYEAKLSQLQCQIQRAEQLDFSVADSQIEQADDWQRAWDDAESFSLPRATSARDGELELDRLQEDHKSLLEKFTHLTAELQAERKKNAEKAEEIDKLTLQAVDSILSDELRDIKAECERFRMQVDECNKKLSESNDEVTKLRAELEDAHTLIDVQREKYEREKELEAEQNSDEVTKLRAELEDAHTLIDVQREKYEREKELEAEQNRLVMEEASAELEKIRVLAESRLDPLSMESLRLELVELSTTVAKQKDEVAAYQTKLSAAEALLAEGNFDKEKELEKLRRENNELTSAYNDLNEEFESHKAEHGSVVISNRDLTARIDALKANLIEYEERYELCKAENAETVQQLEKLTNDFERLRLSFEASKNKSVIGSSDEVERLRLELESSKDERERLRADVARFRSAIGTIDSELNNLRESNERLARDNKAMGASLDKFAEIRDMLEKSDSELKSLRDKFVQLQAEHEEKEESWRNELASVSEARDNAQRELEVCRMRVSETETVLQRYRSVIGEGTADFVEMKTAEGKAPSSEGTADSNNGWEKMADWDASGAVGTSNGTHNSSSLVDELKEALEMITEMTEECEDLRRQKCEIDKELELRQNCVDELMAQTNALQSQQQMQAGAFNQMREWAKKTDREKLEVERNLVRAEEKLKEVTAELYGLMEENVKLHKCMEELEASRSDEVSSATDELRTKLEEAKKEHEGELQSQKLQYEEQLGHVREEKDLLAQQLKAAEKELVELKSTMNSIKDDSDQLQKKLKASDEEKAQNQRKLNSVLEVQRSIEKELEAVKEEKLEMSQRVEALQSELSGAIESKRYLQEQLSAVPSVNAEDVSKTQAEMVALKESLQALKEKRAALEGANAMLANDLESTKLALSEAERVRGELVALVEQKHAESVQYHGQLQALIAEKEETAETLKSNAERMETLKKEFDSCVEARDKALREYQRLCEHLLAVEETSTKEAVLAEERETELRKRLRELEQKTEATADTVIQSANTYQARDKALREYQRLCEHLLAVEETSTKEAVLAEERETELRKRLRELEQKTEATADTVIQSANTYQHQISELSGEIDRLRVENLDAFERLRNRERELVDTQKALSNLQTVLRDLGVDHEAQIAQHEQEMQLLKAEMQKINQELAALKNKEQTLIREKQLLEDSAIHLKEEISRRDTVIEELETQLDERARATASSSSSSHQIDDQILKQLFLSYFTAAKDKQPDIAMLLASVLGYSQEDVAKIHAANQSASWGWFGLGGPSRPAAQSSISITEQFVRFLEKESITASTSRALPLETSDDRSTMRSSTVILAPSERPSQDDLRSLVDS